MSDESDTTPVEPAEGNAVKRAVEAVLDAMIGAAEKADSKLHSVIETLKGFRAGIDNFGEECPGCDCDADRECAATIRATANG